MQDRPQQKARWLELPLRRVTPDPLERWHAQVYVALTLAATLLLGALAVGAAVSRGVLDGWTLSAGAGALLCGLSLPVTAATGRWRLPAWAVLLTTGALLVGLGSLGASSDAATIGLALWLVASVSVLGHRAVLPALALASAGRALGGGPLFAPVLGLAALAGMVWWMERSRARSQRLALQRAAAARSLAETQRQFLATMSHEIRTPMNGVLNLSRLLSQTALDRDQALLVRTLLHSGRSLVSILNDVLDFSRLESGVGELARLPVDLRELLSEVCQLLGSTAAASGLSLRFHVGDAVPARVAGDPTRIRQIVTNLISNAIKFTPSGQVTVSARSTPTGVSIAVSDTGEGIPPAALPHVFEPFTQADPSVTRRFGGTGLGLAICERLCRAMGGEITVHSELGVGTTFTVALPLPAVAAAPAPVVLPPLPRRLGTRVLVAEDHAINQIVIRRLLDQVGVEAVIVEDGYAAVSRMASGERFDLVLMDLYMPNLDGFAATRAIRSLPGAASQTPIVALSASTLPEDRARSREAGMDGHLPKPIEPQALDAVLERWLPPATGAAGAAGVAAEVPSG